MDSIKLPDLSNYITEWADDLDQLHQLNLLDERNLCSFVSDRGIEDRPLSPTTIDQLREKGWLKFDGEIDQGKGGFHPFRFYVLFEILRLCKREESKEIDSNGKKHFVENFTPHSPESFEEALERSTRLIDLAVLLEPIYWTNMTGGSIRSAFIARLEIYREKALKLVADLDPNIWKEVHSNICRDAHCMDCNDTLYLLFRCFSWDKREQLKGVVSGSLWLRHIAEVLRCAFEEVHNVQWAEEDVVNGIFSNEGRKLRYGAERPLDNIRKSVPSILSYFRITAPMRWYVEGETEHGAIRKMIPDTAVYNIEVVNLKGVFTEQKDNIAIKLGDWLEEDKRLRRFSFITFDADEKKNVELMHQLKHKVVGLIFAHEPDFEFANFSIEELQSILAGMADSRGLDGEKIRTADWTDVTSVKMLKERYKCLMKEPKSKPVKGFKGEEWGGVLADYADKHPNREDNNKTRPLLLTSR